MVILHVTASFFHCTAQPQWEQREKLQGAFWSSNKTHGFALSRLLLTHIGRNENQRQQLHRALAVKRTLEPCYGSIWDVTFFITIPKGMLWRMLCILPRLTASHCKEHQKSQGKTQKQEGCFFEVCAVM